MRDKKKLFALVLFILMGFFMFTFANPSDGIDSLTTPANEKEDKENEEVKEVTKINDNNPQLIVAVDNAPTITVTPKELKIIRGVDFDVTTGVVVTDDKDVNLKPVISMTSMLDAEIGVYTLTYTVTDSGNNTRTTTRTIKVLEPDADEDNDGYTNKEEYDNDSDFDKEDEFPTYDKAPSIIINEDNVYSMEINLAIPRFAATATDEADGDIEVVIDNNIDKTVVGTYEVTFTAIDVLKNKTEITKEFTVVDTTAPVISDIKNSSNGDWTNKAVTVSWDIDETGSGLKTVQYCYSSDCTDWKNLQENEFSGFSRSEEINNVFYIRAIDNVNNISNIIEVALKIDKTLPIFVNKNTSHSNANIKVDVSDTASQIKTINVYNQDTGKRFVINSGDELTTEATYQVTAVDNAGNSSSIWLAIDKTFPTINVEDGKSYANDVELKVFDKFLHKGSITINDVDYTKDVVIGAKNENGIYETSLTEEGTYVIVSSDKVGNKTTKTITIDKTSPKITVKTGATETVGSISESVYSKVSFKLYDAKKIDKVTINGVVKDLTNSTYSDVNFIEPGKVGAVEGKNTLVLYDIAGNTATYEFYLDKVKPSITVKTGVTETVGSISENVYSKVSFKLHDAKKVDKVTINGVAKDLTDSTYSDVNFIEPGKIGAVEGTNTLVLYDIAGNTATYEFYLDKVKPSITVKAGVTETVGSISENVYSKVSFKLYDAKKVEKVTINGVVKDLTNNTYSDLNNIKPGSIGAVEGINTLVLYDIAGNTVTYEFTLDTKVPTITVKTGATETVGSISENVYSKVSFKLHDAKKVDKVTINGVVKDLTDNTYSDLNNIKPGSIGAVEGTNTLVLYDIAGNTVTYEFTFDATVPTITVKTGATETVGSIAENVYSKVSFKLYDAKKVDKITINGVAKDLTNNTYSDLNNIKPGSIGAVEGNNTLVLYDVAGNTTAYKFTLDKTTPAITGIENGETYLKTVTFDVTERIKTYIIDGINYTELDVNKTITSIGTHTVMVIDYANNESELITFEIIPLTYTVIFKDYNGKELKKQTVIENESYIAPDMTGKTYTSKNVTYIFADWDKSVDKVTENMTIKATYDISNVTATLYELDKDATRPINGGGLSESKYKKLGTIDIKTLDDIKNVIIANKKHILTYDLANVITYLNDQTVLPIPTDKDENFTKYEFYVLKFESDGWHIDCQAVVDNAILNSYRNSAISEINSYASAYEFDVNSAEITGLVNASGISSLNTKSSIDAEVVTAKDAIDSLFAGTKTAAKNLIQTAINNQSLKNNYLIQANSTRDNANTSIDNGLTISSVNSLRDQAIDTINNLKALSLKTFTATITNKAGDGDYKYLAVNDIASDIVITKVYFVYGNLFENVELKYTGDVYNPSLIVNARLQNADKVRIEYTKNGINYLAKYYVERDWSLFKGTYIVGLSKYADTYSA